MAKKHPLADKIELWRMLEEDMGGNSLLGFIPTLSPNYMRPNHLKPVADLVARALKEPVKACVSVPPRFGKTEILLHSIAWILLLRPEWTIAYIGHTTEFAESKSRRARDLAEALGLQVRKDAHRLGEWRIREGGGLLATGIGGPITGHGCNVLIIDDPVKNREEAESESVRQKNYEWFTSTAATRVEPTGSSIVVHTRWHDDDLIGRLQEESAMKWEVVNLPAINAKGESLWPERWPVEVLMERRKVVGEYDWASLFMGEPRPKGGRLFGEPARYDKPDLDGARFIIGVDPAATEKSSADYSVAVLAAAKGHGKNQVVDILDVFRGQIEIPKLVKKLAAMQRKWNCPLAIEAVGGFKSVPQMLRNIDPEVHIYPVKAASDKYVRAQALAAAWNAGRVRLPVQAPWLRDYLREVCSFTGIKDRHDDQVDATCHAFNTLTRTMQAIQRGSYRVELPFG